MATETRKSEHRCDAMMGSTTNGVANTTVDEVDANEDGSASRRKIESRE
jgi:hypothetical protein